MARITDVLVAVDHDDSAKVAVDKALKFSQEADANLHVVHVMYDEMVDFEMHGSEDREALKTYLMQSEEAWLEDFLDTYRDGSRRIESFTLWQKNQHVGILHAAEECDADLIFKAAHEPEGMVIRTPQDWALLRHSALPVILVKSEVWHANPLVLAAIDVLNKDQRNLNERVLHHAMRLATVMEGHVDIVVAYPFLDVWTGLESVPGNFDKLRRDTEEMIRRAVVELTESIGVNYKRLHIEEGKTPDAIRARVAATHAEMLVLGTVAREGIKGVILGNTSESILYRTECDVAVVK